MRLLALASVQIPGAEATMAVHLEWTYPEFLRQDQGMLVVNGGVLACRCITPRSNPTEEM